MFEQLLRACPWGEGTAAYILDSHRIVSTMLGLCTLMITNVIYFNQRLARSERLCRNENHALNLYPQCGRRKVPFTSADCWMQLSLSSTGGTAMPRCWINNPVLRNNHRYNDQTKHWHSCAHKMHAYTAVRGNALYNSVACMGLTFLWGKSVSRGVYRILKYYNSNTNYAY